MFSILDDWMIYPFVTKWDYFRSQGNLRPWATGVLSGFGKEPLFCVLPTLWLYYIPLLINVKYNYIIDYNLNKSTYQL